MWNDRNFDRELMATPPASCLGPRQEEGRKKQRALVSASGNLNFPAFSVYTRLTMWIPLAVVESREYCKSDPDSASDEEKIMRLSRLINRMDIA